LGFYDLAREELLSALELWRDLRNRDGEARTRHALANIDFERGPRDALARTDESSTGAAE